MNKINMNDRILKVDDEEILLDFDNVNIEISGKSKITIMNRKIENLNILIKNNAKVLIEDFRLIEKSTTNIKIIMEKVSEVIYNHSFINNKEYNLNILTEYKQGNSKIIFNIHGINDTGTCNITADGILGNNINNELLENIHIININGGKAITIPNILVDNKDVIANHAATIGKINEEELKYLMSKGISEKQSRKLILNGFLINIFQSDELIRQIKEIINWR